MRVTNYRLPKSSFLSMEKDMSIIAEAILANNRIKKLLYYTTKDAIHRANLTEEESLELIGKNIKSIPKLYIDPNVLNYLIINFDTFVPNGTNPQFRDNMIVFDIVCHFNQWQLKDFQLRPYRIAAEIDSMFNNKHLTGIGTLQFIGASQIVLNDEFAGLSLMYQAIHGEEDKKIMLNPEEQEQFEQDDKELWEALEQAGIKLE